MFVYVGARRKDIEGRLLMKVRRALVETGCMVTAMGAELRLVLA